MLQQAAAFQLSAPPKSIQPYGSGHIHKSYLVTDQQGERYLLQALNLRVFPDLHGLMHNIVSVIAHLSKKSRDQRTHLTLIPTTDGQLCHRDEVTDTVYRMYRFIPNTVSYDQIESPAEFRESGMAFGNFQNLLSDFPAEQLSETIPHFHDTPDRYRQLGEAIAKDPLGRAKTVPRELRFALDRQDYAGLLEEMRRSGKLPLRVTHNDTKLNNLLFDAESKKCVCVVDLDTVMPGLSLYDFGDAIRFGASTAPEDAADLDSVRFSLPLFRAYTEGFLTACGASLTETEICHLRDGAKMMTLETGVRFLTDYLLGDVYFQVSRPDHNLLRCRTQFKLVAEMEKNWDRMQEIVRSVYEKILSEKSGGPEKAAPIP